MRAAGESVVLIFCRGGAFTGAEGARILRASFAVDCLAAGATPAYGSVTAYYGNSDAGLQCGVDPGEEGAKEAWTEEAYELACGA